MTPALAQHQVSAATRIAAGLALLIVVPLAWMSLWTAALGLIVGTGVMMAVLYLSVWRVAAITAGDRPGGMWPFLIVTQLFEFAALLGLFWAMVYVLRAPGWSLGAGITLGAVSLMAGFVVGRRRGS
ncbi:MAG: hypothetical protein AB7W28_06490 [Armatimonadota bacterium]